jgi:nucleoside-diphosphate-sugar epimerase
MTTTATLAPHCATGPTTLITGGGGFIGLALAERLLLDGHRVVLFDRQPPPPALLAALPGQVEMISGDIRDTEALDAALSAFPIERVIHAAAITPGPERERGDASGVIDVNVMGTVALIEACARQRSIRRVLCVSSIAVYGMAPPPEETYREDSAWPRPTALYGITKLAAEQTALRLAALHGLDLRVARLGPIFGPWEYATGVRDLLSPHHQTLEAARANRAASLPHALQADWLYSRDAASALVGLLVGTTGEHSLYNVGGERQTDLEQWCAILSERWPQWRATLASTPEKASVRYGLTGSRPALDTERLRQAAGWAPRFDLRAAATDYLQWQAAVTSARTHG